LTVLASPSTRVGAAPASTPSPTSSPSTALATQIKLAATSPTSANLESQLLDPHFDEARPCIQSISSPGNVFTQCDFGTPNASRTVVLLGDSQAAMWLPAFDAAGKAHDFRVVLLSRLACNSNPIALINYLGTVDSQCAVFRTAALAYIKTLHAPQVFLSQQHLSPVAANHAPISDATWTASMETLFASLRAAGATSISFLEPVPVAPVDPASCLARNVTASQMCTYPASQGVIIHDRADDDAAALAMHVTTVNTLSLFCTSSVLSSTTMCPDQVNGLLVYADRWHVTTQYAAYVWPYLAALAKL
jgi:hypothetical protein